MKKVLAEWRGERGSWRATRQTAAEAGAVASRTTDVGERPGRWGKTPANDGLRSAGFPDSLRVNPIHMKAIVLCSLLALLSPLFAQTKTPPSPAAKSAAAKEELAPNQKAFLNLPEEKRKEFIKHLGEANRVFQQKRIFEANEELDKAAAIFKDSAELYHLRGNCYVEIRDFDKAMEQYQKANELAKDNPNIEFNIGELYFVTKQWQKCVDMFNKVLKELPSDNVTFNRLIEFKIMLCKMKLGKMDEAKAIAGKHDELEDSPFYYFAQAVFAFDKNDLPKAEEWLQIASRVFRDPNSTVPWKDTLVEIGYIKGFFGNDVKEPEEK